MMLSGIFAVIFVAVYSGNAAEIPTAAKSSAAVAQGNNLLGFDVYKELAKKPGNICFSPMSAEIILALTYQGAQAETATEMATALKLPSQAETAEGFKAVTQKLKSSTNGVIFNTANKIYPANDVKVKPEFKQVAVDSFSADIETLDFTKSVESASTINQWVESQTNNKIKELVSSNDLDGLTRMVLVNAVYFLGKWKHTFEVSPYPLKFHISETESKEVPAMFTEQTFGYTESDDLDAQILELPYNDTDYSMLIILPKKVNGLAKVEAKFPLNLQQIVSSLQRVTVSVTMPKFKIEQTIDMKDILKTLGMKNAFESTANFKGIADENLFISKVLQKTFIEVDEKGTEAAAATAVLFDKSFSSTPVFFAKRPFLYVVYARKTNAALFLGRYLTVDEPMMASLQFITKLNMFSTRPPSVFQYTGLQQVFLPQGLRQELYSTTYRPPPMRLYSLKDKLIFID